MDVLFLSHCVPNPPNKGEKIRAYQEITALSRSHRVHLACFARDPSEVPFGQQLLDRCASVHVEAPNFRLLTAGLRFARGECLNVAYYRSAGMKGHLRDLCRRTPVSAVVAYTLPMVQHVPGNAPFILDMVDVDSSKWFEYAERRSPSMLYRLEAERIRAQEIVASRRALATFFAAPQEADLFRSISGLDRIACFENGVDFEYFDPVKVRPLPELANRRFVVFVGTMDYYPNIDAAAWFAREVLPELRSADPDLQFLVVGNNPSQAARKLADCTTTVVGGVPDVRPYITQASVVVAPLRMARGIQNKVLEALALGRTVLASTPVCKTFGADLPFGVRRCNTAAEFCSAVSDDAATEASLSEQIREQARTRFNWTGNLERLLNALDTLPAVSASPL